MRPDDWSALWVTLELAALTTVLLLAVGTPLAWWLARTSSRLAVAVQSVVALPLVLPPTVLGFYMLVALGPEDPQVRFMFGSILLRADERTDEAIAAWQSLLRDQPEIAEQLGIRERLAAVRRAGGSEQAARPGSAQPSDSAP